MTRTNLCSYPDTPLILVVDDDRSTRTLLKVAMEEEGYQVITAKDGEECINEFNRCQPHMILLDAVMPEMDGFTCCQRLRELSEGSQIPILMITALDDQDSIDQAFTCGAVDYITKPIHWAVLAQRVKRLLTTSKALVELEQVQQQLTTSQEWIKLLGTIIEKLSQPFVLESFVQDTLNRVRLCFPVQRLSLYQYGGNIKIESRQAEFFSTADLSSDVLGLEPFYRTNSPQKKPLIIDDLCTTPHLSQQAIATLLNEQTRSALIVPIVIQQRVWGVLWVSYSQMTHQWQAWEIEQFETLANLLAIAINR
ncbi:response regulator receiver modulated GAF sensor protein [Gloeothece citriformis PCC 7424]|uniref:Response regulator receiver modulated GAF sensor protein n=1 Tax=Gloeothece citriformis (strain PCC 7424) TaxID=65393 RepID=B7K8P9_GLOC7|nr:response regulator [Gloeothece citriformis]ACK71247.1 response regulator receiver modulated GAF sensor protein [Gloeothece citriformis PCC 7424]